MDIINVTSDYIYAEGAYSNTSYKVKSGNSWTALSGSWACDPSQNDILITISNPDVLGKPENERHSADDLIGYLNIRAPVHVISADDERHTIQYNFWYFNTDPSSFAESEWDTKKVYSGSGYEGDIKNGNLWLRTGIGNYSSTTAYYIIVRKQSTDFYYDYGPWGSTGWLSAFYKPTIAFETISDRQVDSSSDWPYLSPSLTTPYTWQCDQVPGTATLKTTSGKVVLNYDTYVTNDGAFGILYTVGDYLFDNAGEPGEVLNLCYYFTDKLGRSATSNTFRITRVIAGTYGIARGASGGENTLIGEIDIEAIYTSSIQEISLGSISSRYAGKTVTESGLTITCGDNVTDKIYISGTASGDYKYRSLIERTSVPISAGYYCLDFNTYGTFNDKCVMQIRWENVDAAMTGSGQGIGLWENRSLYFRARSSCTLPSMSLIFYFDDGASVSSGAYILPRLFYLGQNPFRTMKKNNAIYGVPDSHVAPYTADFTEIGFNIGNVTPDLKAGCAIFVGPPNASNPPVNFGKKVDICFGIRRIQTHRSDGGGGNGWWNVKPSFLLVGSGAKYCRPGDDIPRIYAIETL